MSSHPVLHRESDSPVSRSQPLSYAIVRSGTSRILVLRGEQLPEHPAARESKILHLLTNELAEKGDGRNHYQSNKAAVLWSGDGANAFSFHFYQGVPHSRRLATRMECSNAASASGVAACLFGLVTPEPGQCIRSINLATHQHVELVPPVDWQNGDWAVRFTHLHHLWSNFTQHGAAFRIEHRGMTIAGDIVRHGNVFVMANVPPQQADDDLVRTLAELGDDFATRGGHPGSPSKVLVYHVRGLDGQTLECETACYSEGQQHRSFPGSAAMAMSAFFTVSGRIDLPEAHHAETHLRLFHPSGTMMAHSQLQRSRHWEVTSTCFETPVRLLEHGTVESPR